MEQLTIPLGRIFRIPVRLDYSWFLVSGLLSWTMAVYYYPWVLQEWSPPGYWLMGMLTALLFLVSLFLHECGHLLVIRYFHIPVQSLTLYVFGGVPNISEQPPGVFSELWIALAGPLVSAGVATVFTLGNSFCAQNTPLFALTKYLASLNWILALFNLLPAFPLDGGRVMRALLGRRIQNRRKATVYAARLGRFIAFLIAVYGILQILIGQLGSGVWTACIGWFLDHAVTAQIQHQMTRGLLTGYTVAQAMRKNYVTIPGETLLQDVIDHHILRGRQRSFIVEQNRQPAGLLTLHGIKEVPRTGWVTITAAEAMVPMAEVKWVTPQTELWTALEQMDHDGVNQLPVLCGGEVVGVLSREDVISLLLTLREFEE